MPIPVVPTPIANKHSLDLDRILNKPVNVNMNSEPSAAAEATSTSMTNQSKSVSESRPMEETTTDPNRVTNDTLPTHRASNDHKKGSDVTYESSDGRKAEVIQSYPGGMLQHALDVAAIRGLQKNAANMLDSKNKDLKEQQLTDQANKLMLAADGEKQLEAERKKIAPNLSTPRVNGWIGITGQSPKTVPMTEAQKAKLRKREQGLAQAEAYRKRRAEEISNIKKRNSPSVAPLSGQRGRSNAPSSSASHITSASDAKRRTLTPLVPSSATSNLQQVSSPLSTKPAALPSAMKKPSSSLRRSISQVSFGDALTSSQSNGNENRDRAILSTGRPTKATTSIPTKPTKPTSKSTAFKRVQSKLNVTRDKKQKGRLVNMPTPVKTKTMNEIAASDSENSVSSFISEEDVGFGISKAGPSANKKLSKSSGPTALSDPSASETLSSSIDPALQSIDNTTVSTSCPHNTKPSSIQRKSNKTSPTQASMAISLSSGSSSDFEAESETGTQIPRPPQKKAIDTSKKAEMSKVARISKSPKPLTSSSSHINEVNSAPIAVKPSKLVSRETQDSVLSSQPKPLESKQTAAKVRSDGLLPNGMRSANYRYATLSELKREAKGKSLESPANLLHSSSKTTHPLDDIDLDSDSEEEDSETDSSQDGLQKLSRDTNSGFIPGFKGLWKRT